MPHLAVVKELNENVILLNTPNRNKILNAGPPQNCCANILGKGAFGVVFKAVFREQAVAVKIVKNQADQNQQILSNESNILGWNHKNIMRILRIEFTPKYGIIIMERFEGQCLQMTLDTLHLTLYHRTIICIDILNALAYCHARNLLHLDVKPQNVFVTFDKNRAVAKYVCKLCDFGASLLIENTTERIMQGTVRYMSPEVLCSNKLTAAADIYSLGITMWQLKYRQIPYYWLQCNDIVAYQVVKHQLRPDAKDRVENQRLRDCYCNFSSSYKNISSCLPQIEDTLLQKGLSSLNLEHIPKRQPFRELNLNMPTNLCRSPKKTKSSNMNAERLKEIFAAKSGNFQPFAELKYQKYYQSCWSSCAESRPSIKEIRKNLQNLISVFESV